MAAWLRRLGLGARVDTQEPHPMREDGETEGPRGRRRWGKAQAPRGSLDPAG